MKLILYFGHTGTTQKAAELLAKELPDCMVVNGMLKNKLDYSTFDHIIFGVNIRMRKLNRSFLKFYKKLKKKSVSSKLSCFVIAGDENQKTYYMNLAREVLPEDSYIGFFGGEFNPDKAKGFTKKIIQSCANQFIEQGLPLPSLNQLAILDFANHINE